MRCRVRAAGASVGFQPGNTARDGQAAGQTHEHVQVVWHDNGGATRPVTIGRDGGDFGANRRGDILAGEARRSVHRVERQEVGRRGQRNAVAPECPIAAAGGVHGGRNKPGEEPSELAADATPEVGRRLAGAVGGASVSEGTRRGRSASELPAYWLRSRDAAGGAPYASIAASFVTAASQVAVAPAIWSTTVLSSRLR